MIVADS